MEGRFTEKDDPQEAEARPVFRTGYVAIVGRPNTGKSTLMNAFLGERLSIVTPKPQTTRQRVLGILTGSSFQIIFMDTPGLLEPAYRLQEMMLQSALRTIQEADVTVAMTDATRDLKDINEDLVKHLRHCSGPVILAINKIDRIKRANLLPMIDQVRRRFSFRAIVPVSALHRDGLDELKRVMIDAMPEGPALYPEDALTDQPERFFAAEIIREQLFLTLEDELPYASAVQVDDFKDRASGTAYIQASIILERASQKGIVIGKDGQMLKQIGTAAREAVSGFLGRPVYLDLWIRVRPSWRKKDRELKRLGYGGE
jgi:GTP-binding protein Era